MYICTPTANKVYAFEFVISMINILIFLYICSKIMTTPYLNSHIKIPNEVEIIGSETLESGKIIG